MANNRFLVPLPVELSDIERQVADKLLLNQSQLHLRISGLPAVFGDVRVLVAPCDYPTIVERYAAANCSKIVIEFGLAPIPVYVSLRGGRRHVR